MPPAPPLPLRPSLGPSYILLAGAAVVRRHLQDKACHGSTSGTPQSSKPPISRVTTPAPLARATAAIIRSSGAVGRPALRRENVRVGRCGRRVEREHAPVEIVCEY